jgi:hypothetical protein
MNWATMGAISRAGLSALPAGNFAIPHEVAVYGCRQLDRELMDLSSSRTAERRCRSSARSHILSMTMAVPMPPPIHSARSAVAGRDGQRNASLHTGHSDPGGLLGIWANRQT